MSRMPQVTAGEMVRFLKSQGFVEDRQSGSHLTLWPVSGICPSPSLFTQVATSAVASPFASSKMLDSQSRTTSACAKRVTKVEKLPFRALP